MKKRLKKNKNKNKKQVNYLKIVDHFEGSAT